jgi:hypothetical protein
MMVGRETFAMLGVLRIFVFALGMITGCGGSENEGEQGGTEPD